jgi:hypothetical protein
MTANTRSPSRLLITGAALVVAAGLSLADRFSRLHGNHVAHPPARGHRTSQTGGPQVP